MRAIVITPKRIVLEIFFVFLCLLIAEGMNVYAIKKFGAAWEELWTQWLTICILTALFYGLGAVARIAIRILIMAGKTVFCKKSDTPATA